VGGAVWVLKAEAISETFLVMSDAEFEAEFVGVVVDLTTAGGEGLGTTLTSGVLAATVS